jgi:hypothetical protein
MVSARNLRIKPIWVKFSQWPYMALIYLKIQDFSTLLKIISICCFWWKVIFNFCDFYHFLSCNALDNQFYDYFILYIFSNNKLNNILRSHFSRNSKN